TRQEGQRPTVVDDPRRARGVFGGFEGVVGGGRQRWLGPRPGWLRAGGASRIHARLRGQECAIGAEPTDGETSELACSRRRDPATTDFLQPAGECASLRS